MPFKEIVSTTSETVAAIREIAIIGLVVVFLFNQHFVARYMADYARTLADAGKDKGATKTEANTPLADYTFEATQEALTTSSSANSTISHSLEQLEKIKASVKSPQVAAQIEAVTSNMLSAQKAVTQSIKVTQDLAIAGSHKQPLRHCGGCGQTSGACDERSTVAKEKPIREHICLYAARALYHCGAVYRSRFSQE